MIPAARWATLGLVAAAVFVPFVPFAGPLSADDVLPLVAVLLGAAVTAATRRAPHRDALLVGFGAVIGLAAISSAANATTWSDFARFFGRSAGRFSFYALLIVGVRGVCADRGWTQRALQVIAGAATLEAVFCVAAYVTKYQGPYGLGVVPFSWWSVLQGSVRVQGTFGGAPGFYDANPVSPNFLAAYLVLTIPVTLALSARAAARPRWLWLGCAGLQGLTLLLTFTRGALGAFAVAVLAFGFFAGRRKLAVTVLAVGLVGAMASPKIRAKVFSEKHDRYALYWASAQITADHALFGVGDGRYDAVLHEDQAYHDTPFGSATSTSHNSVLLAAAHYGVLGGLALAGLYLLLLAQIAQALGRARGDPDRILVAGVSAGLVGYLAQDQINNLAFVPKVATQMWFLVALLPMVVPARARAAAAEEAPCVPMPSPA